MDERIASLLGVEVGEERGGRKREGEGDREREGRRNGGRPLGLSCNVLCIRMSRQAEKSI